MCVMIYSFCFCWLFVSCFVGLDCIWYFLCLRAFVLFCCGCGVIVVCVLWLCCVCGW